MTQELMGRQNGAAIRAIRKLQDISLADMAQYLGLAHRNVVTSIENNRRPASPRVIRDAARVLGVPIEAITRSGTADGVAEEIQGGAREERPAA